MVIDFIKRKQAQENAKYSRQFLKSIFNSVSEAISIIDVKDFKIVGANSAFLKQSGLDEDQVIGKKCYELTHHRTSPCEAPDDVCPLHDVVKSGEHSVVEHVHYARNGDKIFAEVSAYPVLDEHGKVIQAVHVSRDVTERRTMQEQLHRRIQELQGLNTMFQSHLSVRSETELAYASLATSVSQLSREVDGLLKQTGPRDAVNDKTPEDIGKLAAELRKLATEAEAMIYRIKLPPAERL